MPRIEPDFACGDFVRHPSCPYASEIEKNQRAGTSTQPSRGPVSEPLYCEVDVPISFVYVCTDRTNPGLVNELENVRHQLSMFVFQVCVRLGIVGTAVVSALGGLEASGRKDR